MISRISKKVIFFFFLFINLLQSSKSAESSEINKNIHNQNTKSNLLDISNVEIPSNFHNNNFSNKHYIDTSYVKFLEKKR